MGTEKYLLIPAFGKSDWIEVDPDNLLEDFKRILDCVHIEVVRISSKYGLIVDEEGKIKFPPKRFNAKATNLFGEFWNDHIAGDAILFEYGMRNGEPDITPPAGLILI